MSYQIESQSCRNRDPRRDGYQHNHSMCHIMMSKIGYLYTSSHLTYHFVLSHLISYQNTRYNIHCNITSHHINRLIKECTFSPWVAAMT
mmetsp:Transcript_16425/g.54923  ORF Transcript_16425/g.54923 Transcript_16425/m.54923 type:complete len:89 (+) Transcript_16425:62-328(+)